MATFTEYTEKVGQAFTAARVVIGNQRATIEDLRTRLIDAGGPDIAPPEAVDATDAFLAEMAALNPADVEPGGEVTPEPLPEPASEVPIEG